jgi:cytochrome c-type biogenesis protein CcmF
MIRACIVNAYGIVAAVVGAKTDNRGFIRSSENAAHALGLLLTLASGILLHAFVTGNYSLRYVYEYSDLALPLFYKVAAFWGGQEGSLLLWSWLLGIFGSIIIFQNRQINKQQLPYINAIMLAVNFFFVTILIREDSSPFALLPFTPVDGRGLNPLLQNPGMTWHPPSLYLGYVGFTIPFAFALSALITGKLDDLWIRSTRRWTLFSWVFLTAGIVLGGQWAYVELGWGGYWAWDPVENASFLPWLTGTAYLHSVMIQERKNMLKVWNMVLIVTTFVLVIFGTFITRSGVISSVHSFGVSELGPLFLMFLMAVIAISAIYVTIRLQDLKSENELDSLLSRESTFLYNNVILVAMMFVVLVGTCWPFVTETFMGYKSTVTAPYFDAINVPIGLTLLILMGICPLIAWRKTSGENLKKSFILPTAISLTGGVVLFAYGIRKGYSLTCFIFSIFVLVTILTEFYRGTAARHRMTGENPVLALGRLIWRNKRRYGGYVVHIGVVMMFIGITGSSAYKVEENFVVDKGDSFSIGGYTLTYEEFSSYRTKSKAVFAAIVPVFKDGKKIDILHPEKNLYFKGSEQPTTEVSIYWNLREDLYLILSAVDDNKTATFHALVNPLLVWIWIGGTVMFIGSLIAFWPDKQEKKRLLARYASTI